MSIVYPNPPYKVPYPQPGLQTEVDFVFQSPAPGTMYDMSELREVLAGISQSDSPFGIFVSRDITANDVRAIKLPAAEADVITNPGGIVVKSGAIETRRDGQAPGYPANQGVNYMRVGRIWVNPEDVVNENGAVYVRITVGNAATAAMLQLGALRSDADGGRAILMPGAKFKKKTTALGELTFIEMNLLAL